MYLSLSLSLLFAFILCEFHQPDAKAWFLSRWAQVYGAEGWSYQEVLPYFIKSQSVDDKELLKTVRRCSLSSTMLKKNKTK